MAIESFERLTPGQGHDLGRERKAEMMVAFAAFLSWAPTPTTGEPLKKVTAARYARTVDQLTEPGGLEPYGITPDDSLTLEHHKKGDSTLTRRLQASALGRSSKGAVASAMRHLQRYLREIWLGHATAPPSVEASAAPPKPCARGTPGCPHSRKGVRYRSAAQPHNSGCDERYMEKKATTKRDIRRATKLDYADAQATRHTASARRAATTKKYRLALKVKEAGWEAADPTGYAAAATAKRATRAADSRRRRCRGRAEERKRKREADSAAAAAAASASAGEPWAENFDPWAENFDPEFLEYLAHEAAKAKAKPVKAAKEPRRRRRRRGRG